MAGLTWHRRSAFNLRNWLKSMRIAKQSFYLVSHLPLFWCHRVHQSRPIKVFDNVVVVNFKTIAKVNNPTIFHIFILFQTISSSNALNRLELKWKMCQLFWISTCQQNYLCLKRINSHKFEPHKYHLLFCILILTEELKLSNLFMQEIVTRSKLNESYNN